MNAELTSANDTLWQRLRKHFSYSFSGELFFRRKAPANGERVDIVQEKRWRSAYTYILVVLVIILLPIVGHNIFVRQVIPAVGAMTLMVMLMANILMLTLNRDAFLAPPVVLLLSIALVMLSLYYGQNYSMYLLFPLLVALPVLLRTRWAVSLGALAGVAVAPLVVSQYDETTSVAIGISMLLTWLVSAWLVLAVTEQSRRLRDMATTDPLTGAYNRRYMEQHARKSLADWERYGRPVSILLIDIDHFKRINDRFGHAVGDDALKGLVDIVNDRIRRGDTLCRFGGEEFVLLLSEVAGDQAVKVADELRESVEQARIIPEGSMTISVGVCDVSHADDMEHWFKLADGALYLAKHNGRNRVELAAPTPEALAPIAKTVPDWR
jgi:diguanylate cyclase (GGDEF)-like protein